MEISKIVKTNFWSERTLGYSEFIPDIKYSNIL